MEKGKVIEVFLPEEWQDGILLDELYRTNIGFKIDINGQIVTLVTKQTEASAQIFTDDIVTIIRDEAGKIIKIKGENNE